MSVVGLFVEGADGNAVPAVFVEHVADAFALSFDARGFDAVFLDEHVLDGVGAGFRETFVVFGIAFFGSVAGDGDFHVGVLLHVVGDHADVGLLRGLNL